MLKINLSLALFAFLSIFLNGFATSTGLSEQDKLVFKRLLNELETRDEENAIEEAEHDIPEYKLFFGEYLPPEEQLKRNYGYEGEHRIEKRFLKSLIDKIRGKNKTAKPEIETTTHEYHFSEHEFDYESSSKKNKIDNQSSFFDDAFYKLKVHCLKSYDSLCISKKKEMYDLIQKCEKLTIQNKGVKPEACKEVLSVYCYVYFSKDTLTCFSSDYDIYVPGRKFTPGPSTSTASSRRISINVITNSPTTSRTTQKYIITTPSTTSTTTKTTTRPTTKPTTTSARQIITTTSTKASPVDNGYPFDGPVKSIPNDAEKLKKIGNFCLKTKTKDVNCETMLRLLKEKFKACEKKPKTDTDCQTFKVQFCSAFTNFPCCADVLAGRTCNAKNTMKRNYLHHYGM